MVVGRRLLDMKHQLCPVSIPIPVVSDRVFALCPCLRPTDNFGHSKTTTVNCSLSDGHTQSVLCENVNEKGHNYITHR